MFGILNIVEINCDFPDPSIPKTHNYGISYAFVEN